MSKLTVTLCYRDNVVDLELPSNVLFNQITPILFKELGWSDLEKLSEPGSCGARSTISGIVIHPNETLDAVGIVDGELLELMDINSKDPEPNPRPVAEGIEGDNFVCVATGKVFPILRRASLIGWGRQYPIDLSTVPNADWVSKEHANLIRRTNHYEIKDINSRHGTIVDGKSIVPGKLVQLRDGSRVQFGGESGPILILRISDPKDQD